MAFGVFYLAGRNKSSCSCDLFNLCTILLDLVSLWLSVWQCEWFSAHSIIHPLMFSACRSAFSLSSWNLSTQTGGAGPLLAPDISSGSEVTSFHAEVHSVSFYFSAGRKIEKQKTKQKTEKKNPTPKHSYCWSVVSHACIYSTCWSNRKSLWMGQIATNIFTKIILKLQSLPSCWHIQKNKALYDATSPKKVHIYSLRRRWISNTVWIRVCDAENLNRQNKQKTKKMLAWKKEEEGWNHSPFVTKLNCKPDSKVHDFC